MVTRSCFVLLLLLEGLLAEDEEKHRKTKLGMETVILFLAREIRGEEIFIFCCFACWEIVAIPMALLVTNSKVS